MKKQFSSILIKICILIGALFLGLATRTHAQTAPRVNNFADSTHHRYGMHHDWNNRNGATNFYRDGQNRPGGFHNGRIAHRDFRHHGRRNTIQYTPEQRQQAMAINKDYRQKATDLFKQDNLTLKQYKAGLLSLQKEKKDKLQALLTQQQRDQITTQRQHRTENMQVREAANLERLKLRLNLSDDQVSKLKSGQEALRNQAKSIHENDNLLPQEKMQQMRALLAKRNDTYRSVLTPDQYSQFEKMSHHRMGNFGRPGRHFEGHGDPGNPAGPNGTSGSAAI